MCWRLAALDIPLELPDVDQLFFGPKVDNIQVVVQLLDYKVGTLPSLREFVSRTFDESIINPVTFVEVWSVEPLVIRVVRVLEVQFGVASGLDAYYVPDGAVDYIGRRVLLSLLVQLKRCSVKL